MVRFDEDRYTIEICTGSCPIEDYLDLMQEIVYVFSLVKESNIPPDGLFRLANLLSAMLPDFDTARKMVKE